MNKKQYSIGEFAAINKVSTRMLRHYDKIGLLEPISVQQNGYRYYSDEQIEIISQIKRLRSCNFLLDEINRILKNDSREYLAEEAKRKLVEMQAQAIQQQNAILSLKQLVQEADSSIPPSVYGVSLAERHKTCLLMLDRPVGFDDVEAAFDELFGLLHREKLSNIGCAVLLNRFSQNEDQNQVGVSVMESCHNVNCQTLLLLPGPVLSVIHYGDYYKIGYAYSALLKYAERNGYPIDNIFMERYFIDSSYHVQPNEYVTEISVALKYTP